MKTSDAEAIVVDLTFSLAAPPLNERELAALASVLMDSGETVSREAQIELLLTAAWWWAQARRSDG